MQLFKVVPVHGHKAAALAHTSHGDSLSLSERPVPGL